MTKLSIKNLPNTKPKPEKMGILTSPYKRMASFRFSAESQKRLDDLADRVAKNISPVSKTDIVEALINHAYTNLHNKDLKKMLICLSARRSM